MTRRTRYLVFALVAGSSSLGAQVVRDRPRLARPPRAEAPELPASQVPRARLEQQVRRQFWKVAKERIGFTDEQMTKLEATTSRFDQRRKGLALEERAQRMAMRAGITADSTANQASIANALDQLQTIQRRRSEMMAEEQQELASYMTPLQRAKLFGLQEQLRKRMQEIIKQRPDSAGALPEDN